VHLRIESDLLNYPKQKITGMRINYYILSFLLFITSIFAQAPNKNWERVLVLDNQLVYVDTTNIKQIEKQISAIGLSIFKSPDTNNPAKKEAYAVKSNYVFDSESKKYTVIGSLFYDKQWKIISEFSTPGRSINTALFGMLIDTSKVVNAIYNKCVDYIAKSNRFQLDGKPKPSASEKPALGKNVQPLKEKKDTDKVSIPSRDLLTEKFIDKKLSEDSKYKPEVKPPMNQLINNDNEQVKDIEKYDYGSDKNVRGMIFTDGRKFCFQISSWKDKAKAEVELKRLTNAGHDAFIVEAYLPNKGGNWFRVRIGYFDSAEDADRYRRNMR
jgi:hypothetical protein